MNDVDVPIPIDGWLNSVPLELHGHRKKLEFFINAIDEYCEQRNRSLDTVNVMEVGCSNGRNISLPLAEHGCQITGVDIHQPSIDWAQAHSKFTNARFICQDFTTFNRDEMFDVVILSDILEHVDDPHSILQLAIKHLREGGIVLVCIPNGYGPYENEQRFLHITKLDHFIEKLKSGIKSLFGRNPGKQLEYNYDSGHVQFFRMQDIEQLAELTGLKIDVRARGALFGGGITYAFGMMLPFIVKPSLWLADHLPFQMVTTWYFCMSRDKEMNKLKENK